MANENDEFLIQRNIDRFTRLLQSEEDANKRATLTQLLEEERAKQVIASPHSDARSAGSGDP